MFEQELLQCVDGRTCETDETSHRQPTQVKEKGIVINIYTYELWKRPKTHNTSVLNV